MQHYFTLLHISRQMFHHYTETTVCSLLMLRYFPKPKLDPSLFNPAHERLCDDKYLLRKATVEIAFIIYGSDRL